MHCLRRSLQIVLFPLLVLPVGAQTLYVPNGTGGIGNNITNGNVGIGTASPSFLLDVASAGAGSVAARLSPDFSTVRLNGIDLLGYSTGYLWSIGNGPSSALVLGTSWNWDNSISLNYTPGTAGAAGGILSIGQSPSDHNNPNYTHGVTRFYTNGNERLRIDAAGNIGVGTTVPSTKLEISNASFINSNTATAGLTISGDATGNPGHMGTRYVLNNSTANFAGFVRAVRTAGTTFIGLEIGSETNHGIRFLTAGTSDSAEKMRIDASGNVGIGTTAPNTRLSLVNSSGSTYGLTVANSYDNLQLLLGDTTGGLLNIQGKTINTGAAYNIALQAEGGNVGIGTASPGAYRLAVNGPIHAKEVVVDNTGWSDYVFKPGYPLASLSEVEAHIKAHGHLPDVPSAAQVAKEGIPVGEMQSKLLAKIEELTLHQIEQEKEISALKAEVSKLRKNSSL